MEPQNQESVSSQSNQNVNIDTHTTQASMLTKRPHKLRSRLIVVCGIIFLAILFGGYYYFNHKVSTKDTSIIMNTQQSLPNKEESVNLSMNTSYVLKNDNITYSVPLEYKVNKSIIKSEKNGVSENAINTYEFVARNRSILNIDQYLDQDLYKKSAENSINANHGKFILLDGKYKVDNLDASLYQDQSKYGQKTIIIPSKSVIISINSLDLVDATQKEIDEIISSIKF